MRLRRIEAVTYGALRDATLGDFGDGLTVVLGPNESGKSTFTSLVRDVLYGFRRKSDPLGYSTDAGRHGRLLIEGSDGSWILERVEGAHGGPVKVHTVRGPERQALLAELTGTVDENMFRVVLGFGLDELSGIERAGDDLAAGLQAAGAGLAVSPVSVLRDIGKHAEELYAERASTRTINALARRIRETRELVRELEQVARDSVADEARATELERAAEGAKEQAAALEATSRSLQRAVDRLEAIEPELRGRQASIDEAQAALRGIDEQITALAPEDAILTARAAIEAVLEDSSGFRAVLESLSGRRQNLAEMDGKIEREFADLPSSELPPGFEDIVSRFESEMIRVLADVSAAERTAHQADARAEHAAEVATSVPDVGGVSRPVRWPAYAVLGLGALGVIAGVVAAEWLTAGLGAAVAMLGVALLFLLPRGKGVSPLSADQARLADEASRARSEAAAARAHVEALRAESADISARWLDVLSQYGLAGHGEDPAVVRALVDRVRERSRVRDRRDEEAAAAAAEENRASEWVRRLTGSLEGHIEHPAGLSLDDALAVAAEARERLDNAREQAAAREDLAAQRRTILSNSTEAEAACERLRLEVAQVAEDLGVPADSALESLDARLERARVDLEEAREKLETSGREAAQLRGKLSEDERDTALLANRQLLEGLEIEAGQLVEEYAAYAVARHMLEQAKDVYERTRRPDRERIASEVYQSMTGGRYNDLRMPMEAAHFEVFDTLSGRRKKTSELSRGAAEQLYLALRVGFITQLGEIGCSLPVLMDDVVVNFDPERRSGAAEAVARLAAERQVIFFTCHEETAEVLAGAVPDHVRIALERV